NASVDIIQPTKGDQSKHALEFGFKETPGSDRRYLVAPVGLWGLARQLANRQILSLDKSNPHPVYDQYGVFLDTVNYDRLYLPDQQSYFDKSLRESLGLSTSGTDYIYVDALDPSQLNINM